MTLAVAPMIPGKQHVIPSSEVSNEQVANLTSNMVQTFNAEEVNNDKHNTLDTLWKCKQLISPNSPLWGGFMQAVFGKAEDLHSTSITFLPMIDLPPSDLTCVYSTLKYIEILADKYHRIPVCTFDQALWWKALQTFVICLGEFHTRMNFLRCIGYIMANTGLSDTIL